MSPPLLVKIQLDTYEVICAIPDRPVCRECSFYRPSERNQKSCGHPHRRDTHYHWCPGRLLNHGRPAAFVRLKPLETEELDI